MKNRDSNIELLRLLCMAGIVLMHFIGLAVCPGVWNPKVSLSPEIVKGTLICSLTILSVNIFGLISGYYGIRFSWKRLFILYFTCAFYAFIGCMVGHVSNMELSTKTLLLEILLPFSHPSGSGLWYIQCSVGLMMIAPLLNKAIEHLNCKEYAVILVLFTIVNVYLGRFWKVPTYNVYGYSLSQLVFLYLIGGFIRKNTNITKLSHLKIFVPMLVCIILWNILTLMQHKIMVPHWSPTSYNHLVILIASICVFLLFLKHPFVNNAINYFAPGSLAIYLFHQNGHVWEILQRTLSGCECLSHGGGGNTILAIFAIGLCLFIVLFDKLRQFIIKITIQKWNH